MPPYQEIVSFRSWVPNVRAGEAKLREGAGRVASEARAGEVKMSYCYFCSSSFPSWVTGRRIPYSF